MATVTGFTAERMLVIENETVVDGEVRGNNLFLQRRDGVEIDAGWVTGAPGGMGPQGPPGVVQSVNDEANPFIYSPRQFDTRAALDTWTSAPYGAIAVVRDNTDTIWQKDHSGWFIVNGARIFTDVAERDARWVNPPDGSICQAPVGIQYIRIGGVWKSPAPRGLVAAGRGPASQISGGLGLFTWSPGVTVYPNRHYRLHTFWQIPINAAGSFFYIVYGLSPNDPIIGGMRFHWVAHTFAAGQTYYGSSANNYTPSAQGVLTVSYSYNGPSLGTILPNAWQMSLDDIGGT